MDPNSPAAESSAHADSDDGGGEVEFANFTDQELGSKIRFWEGELQRGALRKTQDKGKKLRARVGRMKKELDRRIVHRQKQDDTVRRRAVQAKSTCGNGGNIYDFINKCTDSWPTSLSKLEKAKEHDMQILLERAKEFKAKADARTSELVLKRPQCLADLVHSQAGVEKHLLLDLPAESERERSNAHGIHIELQDIQRLLKEDPIDKEIAARRIRMYIHYWTRSYKGACPESLSKLISRLEALATHLEGTSTAEGPVYPAEEEARSYLGKLDAAFTEANDEIEHGLSGREALDSARLKTASQLQEVSMQAVEYERLAKSARLCEAELQEREDTYTRCLITCNDAVNSQRDNADKLEKRIAEVKALVEQSTEQSRDQEGAFQSAVAMILTYPVKDLPPKKSPSVE